MNEESLIPDSNTMLTTKDNPFNPKDNYDGWRQWDEDNGYYTEQYIARLVAEEEDLDTEDEVALEALYNKIYQEVLEQDVLNIYVLV